MKIFRPSSRSKAWLLARQPHLEKEKEFTRLRGERNRQPRATSFVAATSTAVIAVLSPKCFGCLAAYLALSSGFSGGGKELCRSPLVEKSFCAAILLPNLPWFALACGLLAAVWVGSSRLGRSPHRA